MKRPTLHKLIFSILLFAISFLALFTSHKSSAFADWYSSTIYPLFVSSIGRFFGIFPFSVSEIGLYIFVILLFLSLIRMLVSSIYKMYAKKKTPAWLGYGSSLLLLCGCLFTIYTFFCGINYGHTSFAEKYHLESGQYTLAELTSLCNELTDQLNALSDSLDRDSDGLADMGKDLQDRARAAMFSLGATYLNFPDTIHSQKGFYFRLFSRYRIFPGSIHHLPLRQTITPQWFPTIFHLPSVTNFRICVDLCRRKKQILSVFSPV